MPQSKAPSSLLDSECRETLVFLAEDGEGSLRKTLDVLFDNLVDR